MTLSRDDKDMGNNSLNNWETPRIKVCLSSQPWSPRVSGGSFPASTGFLPASTGRSPTCVGRFCFLFFVCHRCVSNLCGVCFGQPLGPPVLRPPLDLLIPRRISALAPSRSFSRVRFFYARFEVPRPCFSDRSASMDKWKRIDRHKEEDELGSALRAVSCFWVPKPTPDERPPTLAAHLPLAKRPPPEPPPPLRCTALRGSCCKPRFRFCGPPPPKTAMTDQPPVALIPVRPPPKPIWPDYVSIFGDAVLVDLFKIFLCVCVMFVEMPGAALFSVCDILLCLFQTLVWFRVESVVNDDMSQGNLALWRNKVCSGFFVTIINLIILLLDFGLLVPVQYLCNAANYLVGWTYFLLAKLKSVLWEDVDCVVSLLADPKFGIYTTFQWMSDRWFKMNGAKATYGRIEPALVKKMIRNWIDIKTVAPLVMNQTDMKWMCWLLVYETWIDVDLYSTFSMYFHRIGLDQLLELAVSSGWGMPLRSLLNLVVTFWFSL